MVSDEILLQFHGQRLLATRVSGCSGNSEGGQKAAADSGARLSAWGVVGGTG